MAENELTKVRAAIRRDTKRITDAEGRRVTSLQRAAELGATGEELAADTGLTPGRISQLVGGLRKARAGRPKPKEGSADCDSPLPPATPESDDGPAPLVGDQLPERYRPGALVERVRRLVVDDVVSDRWASNYDERPTVFVHVDSGEWWSPAGKRGRMEWREGSAAELLAGLPPVVERVYLVGPHRPGVTPERVRVAGSGADAARGWFLADVPGWRPAGHYLADDAALVGRWETTATDGSARTVEVQRAAVWFGEGAYSARDAAYVWHLIRTEIAEHFGTGAILMSTPATTGRDLWRRSIPKGKTFPVLSEELRELIQSTSGQGRRELVRRPDAQIPMVTQYDMRFAYAALTWGMPVGAPERLTGRMWGALPDDDQARLLQRRGRWLVRATVPPGWARVGILPAPADGGRWVWPSKPGQTFTSWVSASELALARAHGWRFEVLEGMHFTEGKPLNTWKDKIVKVYGAGRAELPAEQRRMIRTAARMMLLSTIGAFASRTHAVTHTAPLTTPANELPGNVPIREVGGVYVWEVPGERSAWVERVSHPEWSAEVWGRCRARLLEAPTADRAAKAGALHVPVGAVVGMRTDGITLAGDPAWSDDGSPGRYRLKGRYVGPVTWPQSDAELSALKSRAEAAYERGDFQS